MRSFAPDKVVIPMQMHLGAPSVPCVKTGDYVELGQLIATAEGPLGLPVHASVSGQITAIDARIQFGGMPVQTITIQNDHLDKWTALTPLGDVED